jgi:two-component system chemotaxis response regulator CheB
VELNRLIVVGASLGGVAGLKRLVAGLPGTLPAALLAVLHIGSHRSILPGLLSAQSALPVSHAQDGEKIEPGRVLIAPPDHHLVVVDGQLRLSRGPKENFARPAIDPLFRSAALAYGGSTIGVVLTGMLDDGTAGLQAIKLCGGVAIVQDPRDALEPSMPASALKHVKVDHCVPLASLPALLTSLSAPPADPSPVLANGRLHHEQALFFGQGHAMDHLSAIGKPSPIACPECHGGLWEQVGSTPAQYRCRTGHAFTERSLEHALAAAGDDANWNALRALQERQLFLQHMAAHRRSSGDADEAARLEAAAKEQCRKADGLRDLIEKPATKAGDVA